MGLNHPEGIRECCGECPGSVCAGGLRLTLTMQMDNPSNSSSFSLHCSLSRLLRWDDQVEKLVIPSTLPSKAAQASRSVPTIWEVRRTSSDLIPAMRQKHLCQHIHAKLMATLCLMNAKLTSTSPQEYSWNLILFGWQIQNADSFYLTACLWSSTL